MALENEGKNIDMKQFLKMWRRNVIKKQVKI